MRGIDLRGSRGSGSGVKGGRPRGGVKISNLGFWQEVVASWFNIDNQSILNPTEHPRPGGGARKTKSPR